MAAYVIFVVLPVLALLVLLEIGERRYKHPPVKESLVETLERELIGSPYKPTEEELERLALRHYPELRSGGAPLVMSPQFQQWWIEYTKLEKQRIHEQNALLRLQAAERRLKACDHGTTTVWGGDGSMRILPACNCKEEYLNAKLTAGLQKTWSVLK